METRPYGWINKPQFVILREAKDLQSHKIKIYETRFFAYRLRMTIGRILRLTAQNDKKFFERAGIFAYGGKKQGHGKNRTLAKSVF